MDRGLSWQSASGLTTCTLITLAEVQAYRACGQPEYLDHAAVEMTAWTSCNKPTALFFHAPDVPFYWSRGNGWVAAGMSELLRALPEKDGRRAHHGRLHENDGTLMLKDQGEDGLWRQLLDHPESFAETSGSGMFTFAMITGVKNGWLDEKTRDQRRRWPGGLVKYVNDQSDIREVCEGTNKRNELQYYLTRHRNTGDLHGQAPLLWCASAWLRH